MLDTPVLFLAYNRPQTTQKVFDAIRNIQPRQLFIATDGPRTWKAEEIEKCRQVRKIVSEVDWNCEVKTLFRDTNLGCKIAVSDAINWFFEHVEEGIILEDDVLPDKDFFSFCSSMLDHYRNNTDIMHISATNFLLQEDKQKESYYFSVYNNIWGWATWRRAWNKYDVHMSSFNKIKDENLIKSITNTTPEKKYWLSVFEDVSLNEVDTWDYQWQYAIWKNRGISITPYANLVTNIGFGENATHTQIVNPILSKITITPLNLPYTHPEIFTINKKADQLLYNKMHNPPATKLNQIRNFSYKYMPGFAYEWIKKIKNCALASCLLGSMAIKKFIKT